MKNLKLILTVSFLSAALVVGAAVPAVIAITRATGSSTPKTLSSEITPTKPGRGETVSFLPEALSKFWEMEDLVNTYASHASEIAELTPYNDELASWTSHMGSSESEKNIRRDLFKKYDLFPPTNNVLAWDSKISAKNYRVIISQDKAFETIEREYTVSGSENSVIFENPYTGVDYYWQVIATKNDDSLVYSDIFNFTTANLPRTVLIEGVSNTRDIGGYVGLNSKRMKQGLVYRGMGLEAITTDGEDEFKNQLGIKTELDLRSMGEGTENYLSLPNYYHCPSPIEYTNGASGSTYGIEWMGEGSLVASFGNAIKQLANKNNYPVYFHCSLGRDRTGWMGLALDLLCGVGEEVALKEFSLSLFATSGATTKGTTAFYSRFNRTVNYIKTFNGENLSEKMEDYLVTMAGVTHEECASVRGILLGDIDTGFVPGVENPDPNTDLVKVTFRRYGETPIIKLVASGSLLDEPSMSGNGEWYHGNDLWDFEHDTVTEDMYLDYIIDDNCKVVVHYTGINLPDEVLDVPYNTQLDLTTFAKDGYTYKVYNDAYIQIENCLVTSDVAINVVYSSTSGFVPKSNSRIIVMAGQSNAAGVGHYLYLEKSLDAAKLQEINDGYDNVLLTGYSNGELPGFRKVFADKHSTTLSYPGTFGFEVGLADRLSKVFPDETTYIVKYGFGSASLNYEWISPSSSGIKQVVPPVDSTKDRGWLYDGLVDCLSETITTISEVTNTIPMVEAFMWMQGESDSAFDEGPGLYLQSFNNLINDFVTEFEDNISYKFAVYDAGINESWEWPHPEAINAAKQSRVDENNIYIDTNARLTTLFEPVDVGVDGAHYDAACYIDLGHMFADAYLAKTVKNYKHDAIEIEAPTKITVSRNHTATISSLVVKFNGNAINDAKMSYFAQQFLNNYDAVYSYFTVDGNGVITGTAIGESLLKITAYYHNEVRTVLIPVEVTN